MKTDKLSSENETANGVNTVLAVCCYSTDEGRKFNLLKKVKPPIGERILIHTFDDEVLSVIAFEDSMGIEFRENESHFTYEEFEVKSWSFWQ